MSFRLPSKYDGVCSNCNSVFQEGQFIRYSPQQKKVVECPTCAPKPVKHLVRNGQPTGVPFGTAGGGSVPSFALPTMPKLTLGALPPLPPPFLDHCLAVPEASIKLDVHQQTACNWRAGKALVAASAGSGKSTLLIERLACLLREGCLPESLLTLVYNKAAADSLKKRLQTRVGPELARRLGVFTFHGWAFNILRMVNFPLVGKNQIVGIDEAPSAMTLALATVKVHGIDFHGEVMDLVTISERAREALFDLDSPDLAQRLSELDLDFSGTAFLDLAAQFIRAYQHMKAQKKVMDFADMLYLIVQAMKQDPQLKEQLARRYSHVQIDECQDVTPARLFISQALGASARSWLMCGDLRQAIYSFQGSVPQLVLAWAQKEATILTLPVNRRSTKQIVEAGNRIVRGHSWVIGGDSESTGTEGEKIRFWFSETPGEEAEAIGGDIESRMEELGGLANKDGHANFVCLVRTNAQAVILEFELQRRKLPVRLLSGAGGVWGSPQGRELLAYLRAAEGIAHLDLIKVANKPKRMVKRDLVATAVESSGGDISSFLAHLSNNGRGARTLVDDLKRLCQAGTWKEKVNGARDLLWDALDEREADMDGPDLDKRMIYRNLAVIAEQLGSVAAIEQAIEEANKVKPNDPAVEICSMHRAKGLEWPVVYVCGLAEGVMPHQKSRNHEEELRLFYVAVTRGQQVAILSVGGEEPSPFLTRLLKHEQTKKAESKTDEPQEESREARTEDPPAVAVDHHAGREDLGDNSDARETVD